MAKENKKSLIIWALVALVIGVVIGLILTSVVTTGKAKSALQEAQVQKQVGLGNGYSFYMYQATPSESTYVLPTNEQTYSTHPAKVNVSTTIAFLTSDGVIYNNQRARQNTEYNPEQGTQKYVTEKYTFLNIPSQQNNLSVQYMSAANWYFDDGTTKSLEMGYIINQKNYEFVKMNNFIGNCNGYNLNYQDYAYIPVESIYYNLYVYDIQNNWNVVAEEYWSDSVNDSGNYVGTYSENVRNLLSNTDGRYWVSLSATVNTFNYTQSIFDHYYFANCLTGDFKSTGNNEINNLRNEKKIPSFEEHINKITQNIPQKIKVNGISEKEASKSLINK